MSLTYILNQQRWALLGINDTMNSLSTSINYMSGCICRPTSASGQLVLLRNSYGKPS